MTTNRRFRSGIFAIAAVLAVASIAPVAARTEGQTIAAAPAGPSWDDTSGYGAVELGRAARALSAAPIAMPSLVRDGVRWAPPRMATERAWDASSGYGAVEESRAAIGPSWDETSGYGALEASRIGR